METNRAFRGHGDDGMTMIEMLVAIILASMVSAVVLASTLITQKNLRTTDNEVQGQTDVAVVSDRLARDLRDARGIVCDGAASDPTCRTHLQLWIDANSDYIEEPDEIITWQLQPNANSPGHYNMIRTVNGASATEASTIVQNVAFSYDVPPGPTQPLPGAPTTRQVTVTMYYDAVIGSSSSVRTLTFTTLLRNVP